MKTPSRLIAIALVAALAVPYVAQAAKGDRKNKKEDTSTVAFDTADKSKDGTVSKEEFVAALKEKLGEDAAKIRFAALDKDGDSKLSKEEYAAMGGETKKRRKKNSN